MSNQDFRAQLRNAYSFDWLKTRLDQLTEAKHTTYVDHTCAGCGERKRIPVQADNTRTQLDALKYIGDMGYGKASQAPTDNPKPVALDVDPNTMTSAQRQPLIAQLRARLQDTENPDLSRAV